MSYESPITAIYEQISNQINQDVEDRILAEVKMKVDVDVDKDELIKDLKYDRDQYQKGMEDAIRVLKPMCRHLGKMWGDPETDRCGLDDQECHCQCIWRQND